MRAVAVLLRALPRAQEGAERPPRAQRRARDIGERRDEARVAVLRRHAEIAGDAELVRDLAVFDIEFDEGWALLHENADRQEGRVLAEAFLAKRGKRPTALVCYNGLMARGAVNLFQARGVEIPGDLSVVAIDATRICTEEHPHITAASADPEAMGRKTADLLLGASGEADEVYLDAALPSRFTLRETTAAPAS